MNELIITICHWLHNEMLLSINKVDILLMQLLLQWDNNANSEFEGKILM